MCLILLLGLALRSAGLGFQPLWWDEGYSVWFATEPLGRMLALTAEDIHPPLYYGLLHGWTALLGTGPVALRWLSVVLGTAAIPAIYLAGRRMFTPRAAGLAALLLAINPLAIFYSQEVRMYGLVALLSVGVLSAAWGLMKQTGVTHAGPGSPVGRADRRIALWPRQGMRPGKPRRDWVAYVFFATAALYTQYYAVFLPIGLTFYALWRWRRDGRGLMRWLAAQAVVAVLYLPWALYAGPRLVPYVSQKVVQDADRPLGLWAYFGRHLSAFVAGHLEGQLASYWPLALLLLIPVAIGLGLALTPGAGHPRSASLRTLKASRPGSPTAMLGTVVLAALCLGWLVSLRYPFFPERGERLLMLALPAFTLLAAAAIEGLWGRWRVSGLVTVGLFGAVAGASLAAFFTVPRYASDDYRPLIGRIVEQGLPEDTVFAVYPWQVGYWRSYGHPSGPTAVLTPDAGWSPAVARQLDVALERGRVWFPAHLALGAILETQIEGHLARQAIPFVNEWHGPGTRLSAWTKPPAAQSTATVDVRFGLPGSGSLTLATVASSPDAIPAANAVVPVTLSWRAEEAVPALGVSVRLVDALGQIWAQHDYEPLGNINAPAGTSPRGDESGWQAEDRLGLLIPAGTPPGQYTVEVAVRPQGETRPLAARSADGKPLGTAAPVFGLSVAPADRALTPRQLPIATRQTADLGDGLRFLGYSTDTTPAMPGQLRKFSLFWQATGRPQAAYKAFVQLLDRQGRVAAGWEAPPGAAYATDRWTPGTLMRTQGSLRVPATLPDGRYRLIGGLFDPATGARLHPPGPKDHLDLGAVTVRGRPRVMTPPHARYEADARFGEMARLVGYDLESTEGKPGDALSLTLYWQATGTGDRAYTVFVHLLDAAGNAWGYGDAEPGQGEFPTTGWLPGEYIADQHQVAIAADAQPGLYRLAVGLYDPVTGERLKTPDGADRTILDASVTVK